MGVKVVEARPVADAVRNLLCSHANTSDAATANVPKVQNWIDAHDYRYQLYFPAGEAAFAGTHFDHTLKIPAYSGFKMGGAGMAFPNGATGLSSVGSYIRQKASQTRTDFDGTTNKLTSSGSGTTCVLTGRATVAKDANNSIYISDGTNVTPGWYGIPSCTPGPSGTGTLTLDRSWCTGAVTDGAGWYVPEIIQNGGCLSVHNDLTFLYRYDPVAEAAYSGSACYHILTNTGAGPPVGKHKFYNCAFGFAEAGILHGRYMVGVDATTETWTGSTDDHGDTTEDYGCFYSNLRNCMVMNNAQSVGHDSHGAQAQNITNAFIQANAGGRINVYGLKGLAGSTGTQDLFDIGPGYQGIEDECNAFGGSTDRGNCRNPGLVKTRWTGFNKIGRFNFFGYACHRNTTHDSHPVVDIQSQATVLIDSCVFNTGSARGLWAQSIRVKQGGSAFYTPRVTVRNVLFASGVEPAETIHSDSDDGIFIDFYGCNDLAQAKWPDKTYLTGTGYVVWNGSAWVLES